MNQLWFSHESPPDLTSDTDTLNISSISPLSDSMFDFPDGSLNPSLSNRLVGYSDAYAVTQPPRCFLAILEENKLTNFNFDMDYVPTTGGAYTTGNGSSSSTTGMNSMSYINMNTFDNLGFPSASSASAPLSGTATNFYDLEELEQPVKLDQDSNLYKLRSSNKWLKILQKSKKGMYRCTHCSNSFHNLETFAIHLDQYKVERRHKCPIDDCIFSVIGLSRRAELKRHCLTQHYKNLEDFPDSDILDASPTSSSMVLSSSSRFPTTLRNFSTSSTGSTNSNTSIGSMNSSVSSISSVSSASASSAGVNKQFQCKRERCGKSFCRSDSLKRHIKLVHLNENSRFNKKLLKMMEKSAGSHHMEAV
ncbi:unnamed protein product [Kuraishia capsulata CBS 1993]|uniref:C2H2-type domain-containing protein n=1 Tax=Kuraishia capsulata CBS 1993 TaxID=1382522 RepID=W6MJE0_9ASCO|nr:uncharacterized protein KUCA_T00002622001 [Kuraishia capsulata CBS 1993]CDK26649.1 unnamed protein product [Kuraishia capsulata CBS 1993]